MHALRLITRFKHEGNEEEAALLVYDSLSLTGTILSDDVRDHFNQRPVTRQLYILAPFVPAEILKKLLGEGSLFDRVRVIFRNFAGRIAILTFDNSEPVAKAVSIPFHIDDSGQVIEGAAESISPELRNGWLFSLFDINRGLVSAPPGVHFGKGSKKHSAKFLRTGAILLTSEACATVAYFALASSTIFQPKRIFVDTAPLISVAFALQRIAVTHKLWTTEAPVASFSSYGGLDNLPLASRRDLVLVSASTSGSLIKILIDKGFADESVLLLFYLGKNDEAPPKIRIVCDLTYRAGQLFGYAQIENYNSLNCPLCDKGEFLAPLEGDQFLLESRAVKELVVRTNTQPKEARDTVEGLSRNRVVRIPIYAQAQQRFDFELDVDILLSSSNLKKKIIHILRRFTPMPLHYIVLIDVAEDQMRQLLAEAGLAQFVQNAKIVKYSELRGAEKIAGAGVLVFAACLKEYVKVRDVNAELRIVAEEGSIAYLSCITLAESPEQLSALRTFLTYGAKGRDSFTFTSAYLLLQPFNHEIRSSWDSELELLLKLAGEAGVEEEITARIALLQSSASLSDKLFWPGRVGELNINNDFVYLDTAVGRESISQADIYVVVSNLIAAARIGNRSIAGPVQNEPIRWQQSVYGHTLLGIANFEDYNDAVLRAAFLRAGLSAELNYAAHPSSSARMIDILRQGIDGWIHDMGDFLPELMISLATKRLNLTDADQFVVKSMVEESNLPAYIKRIARHIP